MTLPAFGSPSELCEREGAEGQPCTPCSPRASLSSQGNFPLLCRPCLQGAKSTGLDVRRSGPASQSVPRLHKPPELHLVPLGLGCLSGKMQTVTPPQSRSHGVGYTGSMPRARFYAGFFQ